MSKLQRRLRRVLPGAKVSMMSALILLMVYLVFVALTLHAIGSAISTLISITVTAVLMSLVIWGLHRSSSED